MSAMERSVHPPHYIHIASFKLQIVRVGIPIEKMEILADVT